MRVVYAECMNNNKNTNDNIDIFNIINNSTTDNNNNIINDDNTITVIHALTLIVID